MVAAAAAAGPVKQAVMGTMLLKNGIATRVLAGGAIALFAAAASCEGAALGDAMYVLTYFF